MRLESLPPDAFNRRIVSGDFDAVLLSILGGPSATVFHRFWHSPGEAPTLELLGLSERARSTQRSTRRSTPTDDGQFSDGDPAVRGGRAGRPAGGLPRLERDGAGRQPPFRGAGRTSAGRDAMYVLEPLADSARPGARRQ